MQSDCASPIDREGALAYLEERYGIPAEVFDDHELVRSGEYLSAVRGEAAKAIADLDVVEAGVKILRVSKSGLYKPTAKGMQIFGARADRNVVELDEKEVKGLVGGRTLPCEGELKGFVLLKHGDEIIGVGLAREGGLLSQLPRSMTEHLRFVGDGPIL